MHKNLYCLGRSIIILTFFSFSLLAQQSDSLSACNSTMSDCLQINFINESAIYYHFKINETSSIRLGFSFNWDYDETRPSDDESHNYYTGINPDTIDEKYSSSGIQNSYNFVVSGLYMYSLNNLQKIKFKLGIGPDFTYYHNRWSRTYNIRRDSIRNDGNDMSIKKEIGMGVMLCCQIIIPLYSNLELTADYNLIGNYMWYRSESNYNDFHFRNDIVASSDVSQSHSYSNGWRFSLNQIKFGLIYCF
jgi:hypothetical protein